jgi:adhesin transport system outer membrane protein
MAASQARLLPLQHYARASLQTLESYRAQRELGRRTLLDVLNAENEYFNARSSLVNAEVDHLLDGYLVLASQGLLAASVGAGGE